MSVVFTDRGPMTGEEIIDELTFSCYVYNRDTAPHITPERWAKVFPNAVALEARYQAMKACGTRATEQ